MADVAGLQGVLSGASNIDIAGALPQNLFGVPWIIVLDILGGIFVGILLLWYVFKRGKNNYHVQIYERDSSGIPVPIDTDILVEKSINKGKNTVYLLKKYQALAHPPSSKFIYRRKKTFFGQELWCDYLRERQDFIPVQRLVELGVNNTDDMVEFTKKLVEVYKLKPEEVKQKFIYAPIIPNPIPHLKFEPMDYSMTEMLQVRLAQREMLYADKQGWMQTYGPVIGIGLAAVCIIVVAFLSFQYASSSIGGVTSAANAVAEKLAALAYNGPTPAV